MAKPVVEMALENVMLPTGFMRCIWRGEHKKLEVVADAIEKRFPRPGFYMKSIAIHINDQRVKFKMIEEELASVEAPGAGRVEVEEDD